MSALFLICALALPAENFPHVRIVTYHTSDGFKDLVDMIHRINPGAEVFITPKGQADKLREHGYEKVPFTWTGNEVWIRRMPHSDKPRRSA